MIHTGLRHADDYSLKTDFARMNNFKYTYFNRIVEMWNSIPLDIRLSPSLAVFKSGMKKFLMFLYLIYYFCDCNYIFIYLD